MTRLTGRAPGYRCLAVFVALLLLLATLPREGSAKVFDPEVFTLDNGLQVVVIPNRRAPIVTQMIYYKVGAADEAPGESGLAHFLEHLMFKGTSRYGPGEFSRIVAENGGRENAFTSWDMTAYFQTVARDRLEIVMDLEADRMTNLVLTDDVVLPEREVVREERRSRVGNNPGSQLNEAMQASLYLNHPYRTPVIGWDHEISALSTEAALAFYRRWYAPNNAVLVIAGDVDAATVRPLAERYYGAIPARPVPERLRPSEPPQHAERRVTLKSPRVNLPSVRIEYLAPSYRTAAGDEAYALQVLSEILGGGTTSRLYRDLVVERRIAASAGSGYSGDSYDFSSFVFYAAVLPGGAIADTEAALREDIADLLENGVTAEEVTAAKRRLTADAVYARDALATAPRIFGRALTTGSSVADVEAWPDRIDAVTAEDVNAAARAVLRDESSVTGILLPEPLS
ncbi:MAG TPA: pitrilysin family protein [Kiloniellaceae bacterium]|nr:pitrilysin family protein [Kiloniellaceae bacterium]